MTSTLLNKAPMLDDLITLKTTNNRKITIKICQIHDNPKLKIRKYYGHNVRNSRQVYTFVLWTDNNEVNNVRLGR